MVVGVCLGVVCQNVLRYIKNNDIWKIPIGRTVRKIWICRADYIGELGNENRINRLNGR